MGKSTISMAIFNSKLLVSERVNLNCLWIDLKILGTANLLLMNHLPQSLGIFRGKKNQDTPKSCQHISLRVKGVQVGELWLAIVENNATFPIPFSMKLASVH